jgi:hypothetical protein
VLFFTTTAFDASLGDFELLLVFSESFGFLDLSSFADDDGFDTLFGFSFLLPLN